MDCALDLQACLDELILDRTGCLDTTRLRRKMQDLESHLMTPDEHVHRLKSGVSWTTELLCGVFDRSSNVPGS